MNPDAVAVESSEIVASRLAMMMKIGVSTISHADSTNSQNKRATTGQRAVVKPAEA